MGSSPSRHERERLLLWISFAIGIIALAWLAGAMPADGFYSGDSGVKLIAARNAIAHPARPFEIDLPRINDRPVPYLDRFFSVHDGHAEALQSPLFPVLSALPIAVAGLRGAYILPLVSFIAMLPLLNVIRRHDASPAALGFLVVIAVFASPVFFYGLEFWEHAPAIACAAAATALVVAAPDRKGRAGYALAAAGALGGVAILLRPEALWYVAALAWVSRREAFPAFALGVAAMLVPFAAANYLHSGSVTGPHVAANLAPLGDHWIAARGERIRLWLLPWTPAAAAGFLLIGAAWIGSFGRRLELRRQQMLALLGCAVIAIAAIRGAFPRESLWHAWPAGSLLLIPFAATPATRRLWFLGLCAVGLVWLTSTHDGGAQWGPRFLLIASPALIVLAACAATDAVRAGYARALRQALVVIVLIAGVWTTRAAYLELRGTKRAYARVVGATQSAAAPHGYVVSDVWWFDQVVAALHGTRTFLYVPDEAGVRTVLRQLADARESRVVLVWTRDGPESAPLTDAISGTCYRMTSVRDIQENSLTFATIECSPGLATRIARAR